MTDLRDACFKKKMKAFPLGPLSFLCNVVSWQLTLLLRMFPFALYVVLTFPRVFLYGCVLLGDL